MATAARQFEGWWEQAGYGRQPMRQLHLTVARRRVEGWGTDVIGSFTIRGEIDDDAAVVLRKRYDGRHEVRYEGRTDGEGRMWGRWTCGFSSGRWMIASRTDRDDSLSGLVEVVSTDGGLRARRGVHGSPAAEPPAPGAASGRRPEGHPPAGQR